MTTMLDILSVVGARPQFVKLAPLARALHARQEVQHRIVHTGQHYDDRMSSIFFEQLALPTPELNLGVGSGSHGQQTADMLRGIEACLLEQRPDAVLVYGDTNSTLAAVMAATKLHIPVAHVEAGLRSYDRHMPEEINRLAADHCSDRLYAPTPLAMANLARENLAERAVLSGDVMRDAVIAHHDIALAESRVLEQLDLADQPFVLVTLHRPVNTTRESLTQLLHGLMASLDNSMRVIFPMHPRTRAVLGSTIDALPPALSVIDPLAYLDMLRIASAAGLIMTDSGGLQKEAAFLRTPCITAREQTEWVETVDMGVNRLVGRDPDLLAAALDHFLHGPDPFTSETATSMDNEYGKGDAAERHCDDLVEWLGSASIAKAPTNGDQP